MAWESRAEGCQNHMVFVELLEVHLATLKTFAMV